MGGGGDFFVLLGTGGISSTLFSLTGMLSLRLRFRSADAVGSFCEGFEGEEDGGWSDLVTCWNAPGRVGLSGIGMMDDCSKANIEGRVGLSIEGNLFSSAELEPDDNGLQVSNDNAHRQYISADSFRFPVTPLTVNLSQNKSTTHSSNCLVRPLPWTHHQSSFR
jgi:hypothetical protein